MKKNRILIIGGGAAGLMCAITAAQTFTSKKENYEISIIERMDRIGKKILATGNGRCNLSNLNTSEKFYHGKEVSYASEILKAFSTTDTINFFNKIGLLCRTEADGRVYPYSNQASGVLDVLRLEALRLNIKEICNFEVKKVKKDNDFFTIYNKSGDKFVADKLIIAAGGMAASNLGSNGSGYDLLVSLGHTITTPFPALVQLKSSSKYVKALNGIKVEGTVSLVQNGKSLRSETGEILFTEYGLSGIAIFQLSRLVGEHFGNTKTKALGIDVCLDLMPEYSQKQIKELLNIRIRSQGFKTLEDFFTGMFNKRIGQMLFKACGIEPLSQVASILSETQIETLVQTIKAWYFPITGTMNFSNAQVTAGGIKLSEFDSKTLESKKVKNLYAVGEILDIDGDCGGFNLQWAWSTGYVAGKGCSK